MRTSTAALLLVLMPFLLPDPVAAQKSSIPANRFTVAVLDVGVRTGVSAEEAESVSDVLTALLISSNRFTVADRDRMKQILEEQGFQRTEVCSQVECIVEAGKILKVPMLFAGTLGRVGESYSINLLLIDVQTAQIAASSSRLYPGTIAEVAADVLPVMVSEMTYAMTWNRKGMEEQNPTGSRFTAAVLDFGVRIGLTEGEGASLSDVLTTILASSGEFVVVDRERTKQILEEQGFQQTEACSQIECIVEAGRILKVQKMFAGTVGRMGQTYMISLLVVDVQTAQVVASSTRSYEGDPDRIVTEAFPPMLEEIGTALIGKPIVQAETSPMIFLTRRAIQTWGIEVDLYSIVAAREGDWDLRAGLMIPVARRTEMAIPIGYAVRKIDRGQHSLWHLNVLAVYHLLNVGDQAAINISAGLRYTRLLHQLEHTESSGNVVKTVTNESTRHKLGFHLGIGWRYYTSSRVIWGASAMVGEYLGRVDQNMPGEKKRIFDFTLLKVGLVF